MRKSLREIFSGANGKLSAKRVIGGIGMFVALGCTIALVIRDGSTQVVENLLQTILITSVSLLGLPAVTSIWGSSKISVNNTQPEDDISNTDISNTQNVDNEIISPCDTCKHNKKNRH
jgi:hypothetical protein